LFSKTKFVKIFALESILKQNFYFLRFFIFTLYNKDGPDYTQIIKYLFWNSPLTYSALCYRNRTEFPRHLHRRISPLKTAHSTPVRYCSTLHWQIDRDRVEIVFWIFDIILMFTFSFIATFTRAKIPKHALLHER